MGARERGVRRPRPLEPRAAVREGSSELGPTAAAGGDPPGGAGAPLENSVAVTPAGPDLKKHACPKEETWTRESRAAFGVGGRKPRPAPPAELLVGPAADSVPGEPERREPRGPGSLGCFSPLKQIRCRFLMPSGARTAREENHSALLRVK